MTESNTPQEPSDSPTDSPASVDPVVSGEADSPHLPPTGATGPTPTSAAAVGSDERDAEIADAPIGDTAEGAVPQPDPTISDEEVLAAAEADQASYQAAASPFEPPLSGSTPGGPPPHDPPPAPPGGGQTLPPPYPGPAPTVPRRIYRSRADRKIGGVAGGLAQYLNLDPTVVRIAFVVLTLTGASVLLYIAAWILVPERPESEPEPVWQGTDPTQDRQRAIAITLALVGTTIAILNESWLVLALILIGAGIWLLSEKPGLIPEPGNPGKAWRPASEPTEPQYAMAGSTTTAGAAASAPPSYAASGASGYGNPDHVAPPSGWAWDTGAAAPGTVATPAPKKPQRITWAVLSVLALLIATGIAAATGDWWDVSGTRMVGIGLVTIGVGVVLGAIRRGGARGLIPLGIIGVLLLIPVSAADGLTSDGVGEAIHRPTTIAEIQSEYRHGMGEFTLDLTNLELDGTSHDIFVDVGIGEVNIILPDDLGGTMALENKVGEIVIDFPGSRFDFNEEGINATSGVFALPGDRGSVNLDIEVGLGLIDVRSN